MSLFTLPIRVSSRLVVFGILIGLDLAFVVALVSFSTFILTTLLSMYDLIVSLFERFNQLSNGQIGTDETACISKNLSYILNCVGFLPGINNVKTIFISAVSFYGSYIAFSFLLSITHFNWKVLRDRIKLGAL